MKNPATINLTSLQKGDVVYITVCSQCASEATIQLTGLKETIVVKKVNSQTDLQTFSPEPKFSKYEGGDVKLTIQIDNKEPEIKIIKSICIMSDEEGNEKGINYEDVRPLSDADAYRLFYPEKHRVRSVYPGYPSRAVTEPEI